MNQVRLRVRPARVHRFTARCAAWDQTPPKTSSGFVLRARDGTFPIRIDR
jgi:hypothetical protein